MSAAAGIPVLGGIIGAAGASSAAQAQSDAANYNASVANKNASLALAEGTEKARQQQVYATQTIGQARANYGASGVSSGSGSAVDVLRSSAANAELGKLQILNSANNKAWAYQSGATLGQMQASAAQTAGQYGVATSLFGGVTGGIGLGANLSRSEDT